MAHHSGVSATPDQPATSRPFPSETAPLAQGQPARVTVRYWAAARAAAGRAQDDVPAGTLNEVLAAVRAVHVDRPRLGEVLSVCSVLVGEDPVGSRDRDQLDVPPGTTVEILPPFAGG
jgi:molybdopterin converting factor small subunit